MGDGNSMRSSRQAACSEAVWTNTGRIRRTQHATGQVRLHGSSGSSLEHPLCPKQFQKSSSSCACVPLYRQWHIHELEERHATCLVGHLEA